MLAMRYSSVALFARAANMHRISAAILLQDCPPKESSVTNCEAIYLGGYVVECSLKALVLSNTLPSRHAEMILRFRSEIRHDLERLRYELMRSSRNRFALPLEQAKRLARVRTIWGPELRYRAKPMPAVAARDFLRDADELHSWITGGECR